MAIAIEPCPFCRSQHLHLAHNGLSYCVVCQSCKSKGPHWESLEEAISRWNQTSQRAELRAEGATAALASAPAQRAHYSAGR